MSIDLSVDQSVVNVVPVQDEISITVIEPSVRVTKLDDTVLLNVVENNVNLSIVNDKIDIQVVEQPVKIFVYEGVGSEAPIIVTPEEEVYDIEIDTSVVGVTYVGQAAPGTSTSQALWRIKKITDSAGGASVDWANGNANFTNVWDNHLSYTYGP